MSKDKPIDQEKVKEALKAAGIVFPESPDTAAKLVEGLKKAGVTTDLTLCANGHYVLVVPD